VPSPSTAPGCRNPAEGGFCSRLKAAALALATPRSESAGVVDQRHSCRRPRVGRGSRRTARARTDGDDQQWDRRVLRREPRGGNRLHCGLPRVRRAALVHERARGRAGLLQLAQDAAGDRWPRQLRAGDLFRDLGVVTFKIGDDVFEARPKMAVRVGGDAFRSVHNDTDGEAELLTFSPGSTSPELRRRMAFGGRRSSTSRALSARPGATSGTRLPTFVQARSRRCPESGLSVAPVVEMQGRHYGTVHLWVSRR